MLEWVLVNFPETRDVYIKNVRQGKTGKPMRVPRGPHRYDLGDPENYTPKSKNEAARLGTTRDDPHVITFEVAPVTVLDLATTPSGAVATTAQSPQGFAIASRHSSIFHSSQACWATSRIADDNVVFGGEARQGRTAHLECTERTSDP